MLEILKIVFEIAVVLALVAGTLKRCWKKRAADFRRKCQIK